MTEAETPQSPADRLYAIAEQGLCIGCGICEPVAGRDVVRMVETPNGDLRPIVVGDLTHQSVDRIYDVCPGTRVDAMPEGLVATGTAVDSIWGPVRRVATAWAGDATVRHEGSTAGVLTALAQYLLRSGRVSFILHTKASSTNPTHGEATISETEAQVLAAAGSRYGPTAPLISIDAALDRGEPFAVVAKPCDLGALRNLARHDSRVDELVRYWLTMVCGGFGPPAFTRNFLRRIDIDPDDVTALRYRGLGCPGPTTVTTPTREVSTHYLDYWGEDDSQWQLPWRCKICPDGIGETADLAALDCWPGGSPDRHESETDPGENGVIVRTVAGAELFDAAVADGALVVGAECTTGDLSEWQPHQVRKKQAVADRHRALGEAGRIEPVTNRLRLDEIAADVPAEVRKQQREGTVVRIAAGKATEPRPEAAVTD